jgi:hypothetical protein
LRRQATVLPRVHNVSTVEDTSQIEALVREEEDEAKGDE